MRTLRDIPQNFLRDMVYCIIYVDGRGYDLVSKRWISGSTITRKSTRYGEGVDHSDRLVVTGWSPFDFELSGCTILSWGNPPASASVREQMIGQRVANADDEVGLRTNSSTSSVQSGTFFFYLYDSINGGSNTYALATNTVDGEFHAFVGRRIVSGGAMAIWVDGVDRTSSSVTGVTRINTGGDLTLGGLSNSAAIPYTHDKLLDVAWERALSDAEIVGLGSNPARALFPYRRQRQVIIPAAAAGGTVPKLYHHHRQLMAS